MTLHLIAEDLRDHAWYEELFTQTVADVERFAACWATFEEDVEDVTAQRDEQSET